jgi:hypothetical protein
MHKNGKIYINHQKYQQYLKKKDSQKFSVQNSPEKAFGGITIYVSQFIDKKNYEKYF